jgi:hypothetical protein
LINDNSLSKQDSRHALNRVLQDVQSQIHTLHCVSWCDEGIRLNANASNLHFRGSGFESPLDTRTRYDECERLAPAALTERKEPQVCNGQLRGWTISLDAAGNQTRSLVAIPTEMPGRGSKLLRTPYDHLGRFLLQSASVCN